MRSRKFLLHPDHRSHLDGIRFLAAVGPAQGQVVEAYTEAVHHELICEVDRVQEVFHLLDANGPRAAFLGGGLLNHADRAVLLRHFGWLGLRFFPGLGRKVLLRGAACEGEGGEEYEWEEDEFCENRHACSPTKMWIYNDEVHRTDGPAIEWANGNKEWWLNGVQLTEDEFLKATQPVVEMTVADIEKLLGKRVKIVK